MHPAVGLVIAYLVGSIPSAFLAGKAKGVDLRTVGSGNLGATNVFRTLGWKIGLTVYIADTLKGFLPVALLPGAFGATEIGWRIAYGVAAIAGHVKPIFLLGKGGGKGVATASGVFLALAPMAMLISMLSFAAVVAATGYVSLGSLVSAVVLVLAVAIRGTGGTMLFVTVSLVAAFVFWTHRANIERLRAGTEHRFGKRGKQAAAKSQAGPAA
ncbi:MAG TPA: glycerol-3-phosphate 1-O-acyltransferase PlsY [Gemmatimonadaceae bacterium]|nr:glycerol-3-phosphate 1-O-acyltransferase PlsY [Gemmatimonadaceae bacterium]